VNFNDIGLVILTHLHPDHVAEASRFTKAKFLIQKDELEFARNPHPAVASGYVQEFFKELNFMVLSGDKKICDGLSVIKTPGHTEGGQSVCIETTKGIVIISGLCTIRENFEPPPPVSDTLMKIKKIADILLPLHDTHKNLSDLDANIVKFELPDV
jgi:glyoxylase-like metal-dependent hydrolase (beta-lactamase superfamily II)